MNEGLYYSRSKSEWLDIASMATPHLSNAAAKLESFLVADAVLDEAKDFGESAPGIIESMERQLSDLRAEIARRAVIGERPGPATA